MLGISVLYARRNEILYLKNLDVETS